MATHADTALRSIARRFLADERLDIAPLGRGLINDTFRVESAAGRFVLQRINSAVFPNPERIMDNLSRLHARLAERPGAGVRLPAIRHARDGATFARDETGALWRMLELIEGSRTLSQVDSDGQAREIGTTLGRFHRLSVDLDTEEFAVTLPGFHVTPQCLADFTAALQASANAQQDDAINEAIELVAARHDLANVLEAAAARRDLPRRVVHGDPKIDNILFDEARERALCLIDLDTLQPGLIHHDIGDCLRSCCRRVGPGRIGPRVGQPRVWFDLRVCQGILYAYAEATGGILGQVEIGLLYEAIRVIPFELGLRFLTDHLQGDRYFRISEPGQNLAKAQIQFALVADIEAKEPAIRRIIADCFRRTR